MRGEGEWFILTYTPSECGETGGTGAVLPREVCPDQVEWRVVNEVAADTKEETVGDEEVVWVRYSSREKETGAAQDDANYGDFTMSETLEETGRDRRCCEHYPEGHWSYPSCMGKMKRNERWETCNFTLNHSSHRRNQTGPRGFGSLVPPFYLLFVH